MKKLLFILLFFCFLAPYGLLAESASKETIYTHHRDIIVTIQNTPIQRIQPIENALRETVNIVKQYRGLVEPAGLDHLQSIEETLRLRTGDCEDFTLLILWKLRQMGVPIENLGFYCVLSQDCKTGHIAPMIKIGEEWSIIESVPPAAAVVPIGYYSRALFFIYIYEMECSPSSMIEIKAEGLTETGKITFTIMKNAYDGTFTIKKYLEEMENQ